MTLTLGWLAAGVVFLGLGGSGEVVDDACLDPVIEDAIVFSAADIDANGPDCNALLAYLNALAAKISDVSLHGGDTKKLQAEYDALWVVYRLHC